MALMYEHVFSAVDTHTAGEPTRVVVSGVPFLHGSMAEKRRQLQEEYDHIRTTLMLEPRGHADMFGAILMAPTHPEADLGVVFMDTGGYLAMCGHGSIGAVVAALATGLVPRREPETTLLMDTPAGLVRARAESEDGRVVQVSVENVPGFLYRDGVEIELPSGSLEVDISFGGNFFALVTAESLGLSVQLSDLPELVRRGMEIRAAVNEQVEVVHPNKPHIDTVDLVEIYEERPEAGVDCRNVVVFGEAQADRSPCGTGTSAKMAAMYAHGHLDLEEPFVNQSIIGTRFTGRLLREKSVGEFTAVVPEIAGNAYVTGLQQFVVDPRDPLKTGFHLAAGGVQT
jgi:proline racemase/trans-L-3-hydroxyproline dehydratase